MKKYELYTDYEKYEVTPRVNSYQYGGGICVGLDYFDTEFEGWAPFATLTVNVPDGFIPFTEEQMDMAPIDTNNCPWAEQFLVDNGLATDTGMVVHSGFCTYPVYKFDRSKLS